MFGAFQNNGSNNFNLGVFDLQKWMALGGVWCFLLVILPTQANTLSENQSQFSTVHQTSKAGVMRVLDEMGVDFEMDRDGDLIYRLNDKGWKGYVIFSVIGDSQLLWSLQVRTQFATKASYYDELLDYANHWNANQKMPKIAMKNRSKMVLSVNYPIQFGFNRKEFEVNVFNMFNRMAEKIGDDIQTMRR